MYQTWYTARLWWCWWNYEPFHNHCALQCTKLGTLQDDDGCGEMPTLSKLSYQDGNLRSLSESSFNMHSISEEYYGEIINPFTTTVNLNLNALCFQKVINKMNYNLESVRKGVN